MIAAATLLTPSAISELPRGWTWNSLDTICQGIFDCPHSTPAMVLDGPFVARSQDIRSGVFRLEEAGRVSEETYQNRNVRAEPRYGDLLYSREGTYFGIAAEVPPEVRVCLGQRMVLLRPDPNKLQFRFLRYWLNSPVMSMYVHGFRDGTVAERLNLPTIRKLPVAIPPLHEQHAIAHILGTLDDKIELNRRMNETLEAIGRAIFKSWFVDFDPVRAKAKGRDSGLPKLISDLFPAHFDDSELGEIPAGWQVGDAYKVADVIYGAPFKSRLFNEEGYGLPLIRIRDLSAHDPKVFTPEEHPRSYLVQPGDLVVGMDGEFRAHMWRGPKAWLNQRLCCFKPMAGTPRAFVHYSIEEPLRFFEESKTGTTVIHLGKLDIDMFRIVLPTEPVITVFGQLVDPLYLRMVLAATESHALAALRDTLLPKLVSGEIRVRDAEQIAERYT